MTEKSRVTHKVNGWKGTSYRARVNKDKVQYYVVWDDGPSEWVDASDLIL